MNLELTHLRESLQSWLSDQAGTFPVIRSHQSDAVLPSTPFVNYRVSTITPIGTTDHLGVPDQLSGLGTISGNRNIGVFLQAFGDGSIQKLIDINESLRNPLSLFDLQAAGLVFTGTPAGVQDITDIEVPGATEFEERASLDLMFRVGLPFTADVVEAAFGVIETVSGEGVVNEEIIVPIGVIEEIFMGADDIEDGYITSGNPTWNFGARNGALCTNTLSCFMIRIIKGRLQALLGTDKQIRSAKVGIWLNGSGAEFDMKLQIQRSLKPWIAGIMDEAVPPPGEGVTWNKYDGDIDWETAGGQGVTDRDPTILDEVVVDIWEAVEIGDRLEHGYRELTIPVAIVQAWYDDENSNEGLRVKGSHNNFFHILPTEGSETGLLLNTEVRPYFRIQYNTENSL